MKTKKTRGKYNNIFWFSLICVFLQLFSFSSYLGAKVAVVFLFPAFLYFLLFFPLSLLFLLLPLLVFNIAFPKFSFRQSCPSKNSETRNERITKGENQKEKREEKKKKKKREPRKKRNKGKKSNRKEKKKKRRTKQKKKKE